MTCPDCGQVVTTTHEMGIAYWYCPHCGFKKQAWEDKDFNLDEAYKLFLVLKRIRQLNSLDAERCGNVKWTILNHFRKLVEETGEVARALGDNNPEPLAAEACDAAICALAIALIETNGDIVKLTELMMPKLDKWRTRLEK